MAWLGKVSLGNFGDIAGAVTKISESVKNIEKNFDSVLGFDERGKSNDEAQTSSTEKLSLFEPVFAFVGQKEASKESDVADPEDTISSPAKDETSSPSRDNNVTPDSAQGSKGDIEFESAQGPKDVLEDGPITQDGTSESESRTPLANEDMENMRASATESTLLVQQVESIEEGPAIQESVETVDGGRSAEAIIDDAEKKEKKGHESSHDGERATGEVDSSKAISDFTSGTDMLVTDAKISNENLRGDATEQVDKDEVLAEVSIEHNVSSTLVSPQPGIEDNSVYIATLKAQVKSLGEALEGAAHQSKAKADELSRLSMENDSLRYTLENIKKSSDTELDNLKEEFQQRLNAAERKVYALTKERDMLRREQGRRDASVLLKEKDEIIKQVMAEGEELSKKQAAQEAQMRKLRAQIRELEEEKQRLKSKLQVEEATVESLRKDKAATEKALQDAVERTQVELAVQKEFYTKALNEAKEAEARAEVRADAEAKLELENRLREAGDREAALLQNLEELRQALSRAAQQAISREDMLRRDVEDLEKRCQAAELRYEELVASVPESTRPLLRQIEAMRETMSVRAEAWSGVERSLNARLQEAEAKAAASQERERAVNERLTQTLSRMAVLEAQVSCLKAEQAQLTRSLEKERQRASENRQEYLAALEAAATHEGHAKQLEEDLKELRSRFKRELAEERTLRELLQQEVDREKQKMVKQEGVLENGNWPASNKANVSHAQTPTETNTNRSLRRFSSGSNGSLEESFFLQASLDPTADQVVSSRRNSSSGLPLISARGSSVEQFETFLSQKEGEIASYTSRLASLESTRNALAEELVKATTECEKFRAEAASLSGLRSELDALRRRHASALELMGERDEQVEELKADLSDVKQMYREQIDMLVNQIEQLSASIGSR
ncbi:hypothetical protein GOP47_0027954 [Adiantum capillus-veneris]|nr:hypothetical protein GOP47_0027521 [Adiantum capillus-veneris]KAI5057939.1 hypothetical protein GOP47_0027954 [Adiantum capillus-veneris]